MSNVKVSIIIPVYNTEKYLKTCLDSVINQTLKDIEIICINDGSTDNSLYILNEYAKKDKRIKIISKENGGQAIARNIGIDNAIGEYIGFVDSDDYIDINMFEKMYKHAKSYDLDMNMCKISLFEDGTTNFQDNVWYYALNVFGNMKKKVFTHEDTKDFTCKISVTPYNKLYKRSFINEHNIKFAEGLIFEDEVFFFDAYLRAKRVSLLKESLYYYRTDREGSTVSNSSDNDYSDIVEIFKILRQKFIETNTYEEYKVSLCNRFIHLELWRYNQTAPKYKENFYNLLKEDLSSLFEDTYLLNNLSDDIKYRVNKILKSNNFEDFKEKDKEKEFSIIIACYNTGEYVEEAILSIINQSFKFENNVQIILIDDGSTDNTGEICKKYSKKYPGNIKYIYQENQGQAYARNIGLKHANGKYINFLDSDDKLKSDTLSSVHDFFEKHYDEIDLVSVRITFFDRQTGRHALNYKYDTDLIVPLESYWDYPQLSASSAFFKKTVFDKYKFDETLVSSEDAIMINKILLEKMKYGVVKNGEYYYRKRMDESSTIDITKNQKEFYIDRLDNYFLEMINYSIDKYGWIPRFIQFTIIYDLQWMVKTPDVSNVLTKDEIEEIHSKIKLILQYIDDEVILQLKIPDSDHVKKYFFALKYPTDTKINNNQIALYCNNLRIDLLNYHKIYLDIIDIHNNNLYISGYLISFFNENEIKIIAKKEIDGKIEKFIGKQSHYNKRELKVLNKNIETWYNFDIQIPLNKNEESKIRLFVEYKNRISLDLSIELENHVNLSRTSNYSINENHLLELIGNTIYISNYSYLKTLKKELKIIKKIWKNKSSYYTSAFCLRFVYIILFLFYKNKKIWIFMDRKDMADDNAEHLYKYALTQEDGIKKYFVIDKHSKDYNRLQEKYDSVLEFYSIKHRLAYLLADKIISSHPDSKIINPFYGKNIRLYSGLFRNNIYFLQHGVIKDDISDWLNRYNKNVRMVLTSAQMEYDSFFKYNYNYDKDVIALLGLPRFDNLMNNKKSKLKKQIVIMPSWRENLSYFENEQIKESTFFKAMNSLINNEKLIKLAKKYNYKIIFKPHPLVYNFIDLFDENDYVEIDKESTYQKINSESSLAITDYSSVVFDFAYTKKPILYYQYGDDYHFKETFFDYENDGFGEVSTNEDDLLDYLEDYLKNNCKMKEEFKQRVDKFFKFNDNKNCKRVYDEIKNK